MLKKSFKAVLVLLAVALAVMAFNSLTFRKLVNGRPLPSYYKKGVFHLHSVFSDGSGNIDEICRDAGRLKLDFVILTDHGRPNLAASDATAWNQDTLLIGASEFSLHAGHMAAVGYRVPGYVFPPEPQEAIDEVRRDGGVTFLSHPLDLKTPWTDWQVRGFTGFEIVSLYQAARKNLFFSVAIFPLQYLFNPDSALTAVLAYPEKEITIWDRFNQAGRYYGIYALDSHAKLEVSRKFQLHFPSYGDTFRILNTYVKVDRELDRDPHAAAATIISSLRRGDFFNVIESLAAANGFECYYLEKDGRQVEMGGDALAPGGSLVLKLPFPFPTTVRIFKDGEPFRTIQDYGRQQLAVPVGAPGVYRCQVSLASGRFSALPWILANPIFIARPSVPDQPDPPITPRRLPLAVAGDYFQVEKNSRSHASLQVDRPDAGGPVLRFAFELHRESPVAVDFWTALARRENQDFSGYQGFVFEASGSRPMRFWLQYRTGEGASESAFQHSFLAVEEWRRFVIPFSRFYRLYGADRPPDLKKISSFFFAIDNGNSFAGARGEVRLRSLGLY